MSCKTWPGSPPPKKEKKKQHKKRKGKKPHRHPALPDSFYPSGKGVTTPASLLVNLSLFKGKPCFSSWHLSVSFCRRSFGKSWSVLNQTATTHWASGFLCFSPLRQWEREGSLVSLVWPDVTNIPYLLVFNGVYYCYVSLLLPNLSPNRQICSRCSDFQSFHIPNKCWNSKNIFEYRERS